VRIDGREAPGDKKDMPRKPENPPDTAAKAAARAAARPLLAWYDRHARVLPWRARKGERADPYAVWLSEIMLQQTTVATVGPYFMRFLARWPDVHALAAAPQEEVMKEWAGLGYYSRARNLHACAKAVSSDHGGKFPQDVEGLSKLPGIGPYTAAAIAAIAFGKPATVVDGNVERVVARLFALRTPLPQVKPDIRAKAATLTPERRAGDFAQAMMDLGATVCTPKNPACNRCPLEHLCEAKAEGIAALLPARAPKKERPVRRGACFWLTRGDQVWLRRRPDKGLLGGMMEVPGSPWDMRAAEGAEPGLDHAPLDADWTRVPGSVEHSFTHFHLVLDVYTAATRKKVVPGGGEWVALDRLAGEALPTVMRKVAAHAMPDAGPLFAKR
jgi:A/G-specific adenine glycosylase